ncbi:MAG: HEAT repeat domain-containing protein, partial [Phycisphaerae bacterium]|nr:HEAT repeat domain-containing protein [Phycisphaerae bacterium]
GALDTLKKLASEDSSKSVRVIALVSLGLLDSPKAEQFLTGRKYPKVKEWEASLVAVGLMSKPTPKSIVGLQKALKSSRAGPATVSARMLKYHTDPANVAFLRRVLSRRESPWLASEAILALGATGDAKSVRSLSGILLATDRGKALPGWQTLHKRHRELLLLVEQFKTRKLLYDQAYEKYVNATRKFQKNNPNAPGPEGKKTIKPGTKQILIGVERIYQSCLRASAAIALGQINHPNSCRVLRQVLKERNDEYSDLYKGFAIMSLGQLGDSKALPIFMELLNPTRKGRVRKSSAKLKSPLRGYAALALGLYARPVITPQGPQNRPHYEKVCQLLAKRMTDRKETLEVRTSAALALGLTGQTENLRLLQPATKTIRTADEEILVGYTLLARGMLGDKNIIPTAKKFLAVANDRVNVSGILARRAAVLGLGVLGSQEGIPILVDAWSLNYYVNREVTLAFSLCEAYNMTEPLVKMLKESKNPLEQAFAARCLGELFTRVRPQRISRLINGSNYTVKNRRMVRFQALANEFLFNYLIPAFGKDWR